MGGVNPGSLASQMPARDDDLQRKIRDQQRALREQGSANTLQAAQFGQGGILVTDNGAITFMGTGALNTSGALTTSGSFTAATSLNADSLAIIHAATVGTSLGVSGNCTVVGTLNVGSVSSAGVGSFGSVTAATGSVTAAGDVSAGGQVISAGVINSPGTKTNTVTISYSAVYIDGSGNMGGNTSTRRYKTNIGPAAYDLDAFLALPAYAYQRTTDILELGAGAAPWFDGMMAEDVAPVLPLHVWYDEAGQVEGIRFEELVTPLIQAVKRERAERLAMQAKYESRLAALEAAAGIS